MGDPVLEALGEVEADDAEDPVLKALGGAPSTRGGAPAAPSDTPEIAARKAANEQAEAARVKSLEYQAARGGLRPDERSRPVTRETVQDALKRADAPKHGDPTFGEHFAKKTTVPVGKYTAQGVADILDATGRGGDATLALVSGQPKRAAKIISTKGESLESTGGQGRVESALNRTASAVNPTNLLNLVGGEMAAPIKAASKGLSTAEYEAAKRAMAPLGEAEKRGILGHTLNDARKLREEKQITRSMKADEGERLKGVFGLRQPPKRVVQPGQAPLAPAPKIITDNLPVTPAERGPSQSIPLGPGPMTRLGHTESEFMAYEKVTKSKLGTTVYKDGEPVELIAHRPDQSANILHKNGKIEYGVPYTAMRPTKEGAPISMAEPPSTPLDPPMMGQEAVNTAPAKGAPGSAPSPTPTGLTIDDVPKVPDSAWTRAVDKTTSGMGSWLQSQAPGAVPVLRHLASRSKFAEYSDEAGNLFEAYIASKGRREGDVSDFLIPADRAFRKAKPTPEEMSGMFKYASSRSNEVPDLVKNNPAIAEAIDYYNGVLRPQLPKAGYGSEESFGQFERYLPNIVTAEMDKPGLFRTKGPRAGRTRLRTNNDGVTMIGMNKQEAKDLAESLTQTTGIKPVVVGPYGKSSYAKFATTEDRDAFVRALEVERSGAGKWAGKIKYETFDAIPEDYLQKPVAEGGLGLVTDPQALLAAGMKTAADELSSREFFQSLTKFAKAVEPGQMPDKGFHIVPNTPRWGALAGTQVEDKLWDALSDFEPRQMGFLGNLWQGTIRAFKKNAIIKMATGARNGYYNAGSLSVGNRLIPGSTAWFKEIKAGVDDHLAWWKTGKRPPEIREFQTNGGILGGHSLEAEGLEKFQELIDKTQKGTMPASDFAEEFVNLTTGSPYALQKGKPSMLKRGVRAVSGGVSGAARAAAMGEGVGTIAERGILGAAQNTAIGEVAKYGTELYQRTDDIFKIAWYRNWKKILAKENPNLSADEIGRMAAKKVNDRSQVFAMRSPITDEASRTGVVPFASWWDNKVRIETNIFREDPHLFALMQAQGTMQKAAGATGLILTTGIPASVMWDWIKRNPGMTPVSSYKDERGEWHVVGWRHQYITPDPVAATQQMAQNPGEAVRDFAFQNPVVSGVAKGAALFSGGPRAVDPTFMEGRPVLEKGEPPEAGYLRFWTQGLGSSIGPAGQQTEEAIKTLSGDQFKSSVEKRSGFRTALDIVGGIKTSDQPVGTGGKFAGMGYEKAIKQAGSWWNSATSDPDIKRLPQGAPERVRLDTEYDDMVLDAFQTALDKGARVAPPTPRTKAGRKRLASMRSSGK